ncbi:MAG: AmpG family muropeptide MFS transporter [Rhodospirillaceae bacterium]
MAEPVSQDITGQSASERSWGQACREALRPEVLRMGFLGFSAGLPILLIFSTLSVWLREAGVDRSTVTFLSWAALGYSFKFVWAPLVDRLPVPVLTKRLGRRRGWMLTAQLALIGAMLWTSAFDPITGILYSAIGAVLIGFASATQDIVIDAYRIESADARLQSMMSSFYIAGYRVGMLVAGAGALWLAEGLAEPGVAYDFSAWAWTYRIMAVAMLIGVLTTLLIPEPTIKGASKDPGLAASVSDQIRFLGAFLLCAAGFVGAFTLLGAPLAALSASLQESLGFAKHLAGFLTASLRLILAVGAALLVGLATTRFGVVPLARLRHAYYDPVSDFFERYGKVALLLLVLIGTYRIADVVMGVIANVFYIDLGFTKGDIATYTKFWGLIATLIGGFLGGLFALRFGVMRAMMTGALLAAVTNVLFAVLAGIGPSTPALAVVIVADNISAGMASAAFVAYLSSLTNVSFTAMQYALFSSLMTLFPKLLAGYSGGMVDAVGYQSFFIGTALLGLPVLVLVWLAARLTPPDATPDPNRAVAEDPGP